MEGILPLLLWGGLIFLMMRFGCGAHMFGHGHRQKQDESAGKPGMEKPAMEKDELVWTAPEQDTDPVCGKDVITAGAKSSVHNGWVYYFCSPECRAKFETAPETYLGLVGREDK
ncbi:MAG: YHS domain-containing protein [Rhodospirillales bacterium]|nr:YHS domain-containing protein [Rhodospirillales bacterium]